VGTDCLDLEWVCDNGISITGSADRMAIRPIIAAWVVYIVAKQAYIVALHAYIKAL